MNPHRHALAYQLQNPRIVPSFFMMKQGEAQERKAFRDWFDKEAVQRLADQTSAVSSNFEGGHFFHIASKRPEDLEFYGRIKHRSIIHRDRDATSLKA
jgi:hypothetical protein